MKNIDSKWWLLGGAVVGVWWFGRRVAESAGEVVEAGTSKALRWSTPMLYADVYSYLKGKIYGDGDAAEEAEGAE